MERFRESTTPAESPAGIPFSFPMLLIDAANRHGHRAAFSDRADGFVRELSFNDCLYWGNAIAHGLAKFSEAPLCVIFSESRIEWPVAFFGILGAGGIVVPADPRFNACELANILRTIGPTILMVSPKLLTIAEDAIIASQWCGTVMTMSLNNDGDDRAIAALAKATGDFSLTPRHDNDIAIIASTAGTCGNPKAVQLSFGSIFHQMWSLRQALALKPCDSLMSVLPLSNVVEMTCNLLTAFVSGCHVHFPRSLLAAEMHNAMKRWKITHMIVVPRMILIAESLIKLRLKGQYGAEGVARLTAMQDISRAASHGALRRHLSRPILNAVAPCLRRILVCGSMLNADTQKFFHYMGIDVLQSYGLLESSGLATVNLRSARFGSAGSSLPGCSVRIEAPAETTVGEILVRGPHLFRGYYARGNSIPGPIDDDGWLHTGDWGFLSHDDFLHVIDRKDHIIVLEDGRRVYPREVEKVLLDSSLFDEVCVMGLGHVESTVECGTQVCAIVVPKIALRKLKSMSELQALCEREVSDMASVLPEFKRPRRVIVRMTNLPATHAGTVKITQLENS